MPRTPAVARPMGRTSDSEKRMVCPWRETMNTSSDPLVWITRTSSSPSCRLMAMSPVRNDESYSDIRVFFTMPLRVAKNR